MSKWRNCGNRQKTFPVKLHEPVLCELRSMAAALNTSMHDMMVRILEAAADQNMGYRMAQKKSMRAFLSEFEKDALDRPFPGKAANGK